MMIRHDTSRRVRAQPASGRAARRGRPSSLAHSKPGASTCRTVTTPVHSTAGGTSSCGVAQPTRASETASAAGSFMARFAHRITSEWSNGYSADRARHRSCHCAGRRSSRTGGREGHQVCLAFSLGFIQLTCATLWASPCSAYHRPVLLCLHHHEPR